MMLSPFMVILWYKTLKNIGDVKVWQLNALAWIIFSKGAKWDIGL